MSGFALANGIYRCLPFDELKWLAHGFGTRHASPRVDVTLRQIHSDRVIEASGVADRACEGDALTTNQTGRAIGVRTADCVPILLVDVQSRVVAAVHAGWRGSAAAIVLRTIERMQAYYETNPIQIYAAIGPCIRECCYEVGPEVVGHFRDVLPELRDTPGKQHLDLALANRRQLEAALVATDQIFDSGLCTFCDGDQFYSYRREPLNPGRLLSGISRVA